MKAPIRGIQRHTGYFEFTTKRFQIFDSEFWQHVGIQIWMALERSDDAVWLLLKAATRS